MHTVDLTRTLAELVTERPAFAPELERLGLDYCCGGRRSPADACVEAGLDPALISEALGSVQPDEQEPEAWASMGAGELVDHPMIRQLAMAESSGRRRAAGTESTQ